MPALNTLTITVEADGVGGVVNVWDNLPYQTITYAGAVNSFRPATISDQIVAAVAVARTEVTASGDQLKVHVPKTQNKAAIDAVVVAHDAAVVGQAETIALKAAEAKANSNSIFSGIRGLPPHDQITIVFARGLMAEEGKSQALIDAVDTLAEANTEITTSAWWVAMTAAERARWNTFLQVLRRMLQALVYLSR